MNGDGFIDDNRVNFSTGGVTIANGVLFGGVGDAPGTVQARDAATGEVVWSYAGLGAPVVTHPAVADGVVYWGAGYADWLIPNFIANVDGGKLIAFALPTLQIGLDIKPGNELNVLNPTSRGVTLVAILGSDGFDVADVDASTLAFGPAGASPAFRGHGWRIDVNRDEFTDLLTFYSTRKSGIAFGDMEACLIGET